MAKQTFTTGQVLTAAQMTSLQQTAMGGGAATAKTASYVLVAADAGTTVAMNAAGATTITVNTGLFAAGDTVFIQNLGAGACTVTAGTATVATAGSLILPQNDAGILYFTATGTAIFYDYIQAGAVSPLTTKGDVYTFSTSDARLGVGANNTVLTADSAEATGLKWAAPAGAGANWSLLNSGGTALSGSQTVTVSGISGKEQILIEIVDATTNSTVSRSFYIQINGDTGLGNYDSLGNSINNTSTYNASNNNGYKLIADDWLFATSSTNASSLVNGAIYINGGTGTGTKYVSSVGGGSASGGTGHRTYNLSGIYKGSAAITSVSVYVASVNFNGGTIYVYGSAN